MNKKTDFILDSMIRAYLNEQNPIGSMLLQDSLNMPASTIRVYFKQLDNDGYISKLHASGGRIPTQKAMKYYWKDFFNKIKKLKISVKSDFELLNIVNSNELFCMVIDKEEVFLENVLNISNRFLILDFNQGEIVLNFNDELKILFNELKGYEINDIKTILYRLNLVEVLQKIDGMLSDKISFLSGEKIFANIIKLSSFSSILGIRLLDYFNDNLIFDELFMPDFMGVRLSCDYKRKKSDLILAGSIFKDYENIINQLREAI